MIRAAVLFSALLATSCAVGVRTEPGRAAANAEPVATALKGYLTPDALDGKAILAPPPPVGSPRDAADRAFYEETRALKDGPRWRAAQEDNDLWQGRAMKRYACAMGREISKAETPAVERLLHRIELDGRTVGTPPKDFYNRDRPSLHDDKPICVARGAWMAKNASYPSGHALTQWAWGLVLAQLDPAHATALTAAGREAGESRAICGVHFLSDVEAGRTLGSAMVARLAAEPAFQADLATARKELAARPARPPSDCGVWAQ